LSPALCWYLCSVSVCIYTWPVISSRIFGVFFFRDTLVLLIGSRRATSLDRLAHHTHPPLNSRIASLRCFALSVLS
ncbi:hypothetical protein CSUI_008862, partial [Cystoisospora suis]